MPIKSHRISRRFTILSCLVLSLLIIASSSSRAEATRWYAVKDNATQPYYSGRIIVKFKEKTLLSSKTLTVNKAGLKMAKNFKKTGLSVLEVKDKTRMRSFNQGQMKKKVAEMVDILNSSTSVKYAEPDYLLYANKMPNDPRFGELLGLHYENQSGYADADIDAPEAWDLNTGDPNIVVAVIDSGVDYNHEDLAANMWKNPGEIEDNGIDDDGNGYVDDIYGIDALHGNGDPMDDYEHGTHCAGTIGAVGNNGIGVTGVNWNVKIMALKFLDQYGTGYTSYAIECLEYAIMMKETYGINIKVTSNSYGGEGYSQAHYDAIEAARDADILFVAAAGNDAKDNDIFPFYPSSFSLDNIIAVTAIDYQNSLCSFSNYGSTSVDLVAPGYAIMSTLPNNSYGYRNGTSMATPHVAGAAALIWAGYPSYNWSDVKTTILNNVEQPSYWSDMVSGGRLNISNAVFPMGPAILLESPEEGVLLDVNQQTEIIWLTNKPESAPYVKIEFSNDGGSTYTTIEDSIPNLDTYTWLTPVTASDQCILRISDTADGDPSGTTEMFSIHTLSYISGIVTGAHSEGITTTINYSGPISGSFETDPDGQYTRGLLPGTYDVYASAGEFTSAVQTITIPPDASSIDFDISYPVLSVTPENISRSAGYADTVEVTVTISNPGDTGLEIALAESDDWLQPAVSSLTVPPGDSSDVLVTLDSTGLLGITHNANLFITHNDPGAETPFSVPVFFEVDGERHLTASPMTLDFGTTLIGVPPKKTITLNNNGSETSTITALYSDNAFFTHNAVLPIEIPPFSSAAFQVIFAPTEELTYNGTLTINSNAEDNPNISISLTGTGDILTLSDGLVAYYPFSGNANDASGNNNNGTVYGAVLTEDQNGVPQNAYYFDGINDRIEVPYRASLNSRDAITMSVWIKYDQIFNKNEGILGKYYAYQLQFNSTSGCPGIIDRPYTSQKREIYTPSPLNNGQWYHVVGTNDGQTMKVYLDGILVNSHDYGSVLEIKSNSNPLIIGRSDLSGARAKGIIDEVRIYNRVLSPSEVQELTVGVAGNVYGTISGAVKEGIKVDIYQKACGSDVLSDTTTTDVDGNYSFTGLSSGDYMIIPGKDNYNFIPELVSVSIPQVAPQAYDFTATEIVSCGSTQ